MIGSSVAVRTFEITTVLTLPPRFHSLNTGTFPPPGPWFPLQSAPVDDPGRTNATSYSRNSGGYGFLGFPQESAGNYV